MGHVMRTLSIAEALRVAGAHVLYVCADKQPKEIIESRGFEVLVLETDPANLMGEFQRLSLVLRDIDARAVLFDGCNYRPLLFSNPLFRGLFHF